MNAMTKVRKADTAIGQVLGAMGTACVRTPCGARRIENVRPGDMLVTRDNGLQTVRMVWSKTISAAELKANPSHAPIRLGARAIGPMMPQREIMLAPSHRVLVPGWRLAGVPDTRFCLIEAQEIAKVSDAAYIEKSLEEVTYYNIVFDEHQVFAVNGLPIESFLPSKKVLSGLDAQTSQDISELFAVDEPGRGFPSPRYDAPAGLGATPTFV